ncbi:hypothetical protein [Gluconobacter kondonii]|uniref:hypothetical protein n=1 Tax=Gluconobacter kondonii TaxID=941463 RepID=UPI0020113EF2|nr:hypothetical protein [Gluconobacter kondonii]
MILDRRATLAEAQDALYRDDPKLVARIYDQIFLGFWERTDFGTEEGHSNTAHKKKTRSKHPKPKRRERGVTISEMASEDSLWLPEGDEDSSGGIRLTPDKTALYRLLEANGWLTRAPYGRKQYRWFVTDEAVKDGYGQNVDPSNLHSITLSGGRKAFPFPVFYPGKLKDIAWTLGWDLILKAMDGLDRKKARLSWLLSHHAYLPNQTMADLSGAGLATVERHRQPK